VSAPSLSFTSYDTSEIGSIALLFARVKEEERCGIYVLRFEGDANEACVGQAKDVVNRYAQHRRRWGDIITLEFAPCGPDQLDECERRVVSAEEQKGTSLCNLMLTRYPGGWGDIEVDVEPGFSVILPLERSRRATLASEPVNSPLSRFWKLSQREDYSVIRWALANYINQTIPDPVMTTHGLWTLTALPTTGRSKEWQRLLAVNCGRLETLYIDEVTQGGSVHLEASVNLHPDIGSEGLQQLPLDWGNTTIHSESTYRAADVVAVQMTGLKALTSLLSYDSVLDAAYELNLGQMRQGSRLFAKYHNAPFA
jgi:hypothetical protein